MYGVVAKSMNYSLGCFHVLAIVFIDSAAVPIWMHVSFGMVAFSGCMSSSGTAVSCGIFSFFKEPPHWAFFRAISPIYILTNSVGVARR